MIRLMFPCKYIGVTQDYKSNHKAIDLGWDSKYGGPNHEIICPQDGIVTYVKNNMKTNDKTTKSYGNYIKIDHGSGLVTLMAHLKYNSIKVKVGDKVKYGQKLAIMGNTGYSFGTHCHFEVILDGIKVNPLLYTYYDKTYTVGSNTIKKYKPMIINLEENMENKINDDIKQIDDINNTIIDDVIFEYICEKSGMYKIYLNKDEKLIIKD